MIFRPPESETESDTESESGREKEKKKPYNLRTILKGAKLCVAPKPKKSGKEIYHERIEKLQQKPGELQEFRLERAKLMRENRASWSPNRKAVERKKSAERMTKSRAKRKLQMESGEIATKRMTRKEIKDQRERWRDAKTKSREKQSVEKKKQELARRREQYSSKRRLIMTDSSPDVYAGKVIALIKEATPRKKRRLQELGIPISLEKPPVEKRIVKHLKKSMQEMQEDQTQHGQSYYRNCVKALSRNLADNEIRKHMAITCYSWQRSSMLQDEISNIERVNKLKESDIGLVSQFYINKANPMPDTRHTGKLALDMSVKNLHKSFISTHFNISASKFHKLRPKNCVTVDRVKFISCLCEYCVNVDFLLEGVKTALSMKRTGKAVSLPGDKFELVNLTLCAKPKDSHYHDMKCVTRQCEKCGVDDVYKVLEPLKNVKGAPLKWKKWVNSVVTNSNGTTTNKKTLKEMFTNSKELLEEVACQLKSFPLHLFNAKWQRDQFNEIKNDPPPSTVVSVIDFAENYRCVHQFEAASAFYHYSQVTIHPMIVYYNCPKCSEQTTHNIACISPDLIHDPAAVSTFINEAEKELSKHVKFDNHVQFSDGCGPQYKSKRPFRDISKKKNFQRNYFGSRHGKNPCDSFGGLIKSKAAEYVKTSKGNIRTAKEMHTFCEENLMLESSGEGDCVHKKRTFIYIEEIDRSETSETLTTLCGTQKTHSIQSTGENGIIEYRNLTCFCKGCSNGQPCLNSNYVEQFKKHNTIAKDKKEKKSLPERKKKTRAIKEPIIEEQLQKTIVQNEGTSEKKPSKKRGRPPGRNVQNEGSSENKSTNKPGRHLQNEGTPEKKPTKKLRPLPGRNVQKEVPGTSEAKSTNKRGHKVQNNSANKPPLNQVNVQTEEKKTPSENKKRKPGISDTAKKDQTIQSKKNTNEIDVMKTKDTNTGTAKKKNATIEDPVSKYLREKLKIKGNMSVEEISIGYLRTLYMEPLESNEVDLSLVGLNKTIDKASLKLKPYDLPPNLFPVSIFGDGNCLPRCLSVLLYGHEESFTETRIRICTELACNSEYYKSNDCMRRGSSGGSNVNTVYTFCMLSQYLQDNERVSEVIDDIFEREVTQSIQHGQYMGIWHLAAIASILERPVKSVYPTYAGYNIRNDINRIFYPRFTIKEEPVYIMWTNTTGTDTPEHIWAPNHFVLCLPITIPTDYVQPTTTATIESLKPHDVDTVDVDDVFIIDVEGMSQEVHIT